MQLLIKGLSMDKIRQIISNNRYLLKKVYLYNRTALFLRLVFAIYTSITVYIGVILPKYLLTYLFEKDFRSVVWVLSAYAIYSTVNNILSVLYDKYIKLANERMYVKIINEFLRKSIRLDLSFYDKEESYNQFTRSFGNCCSVINSCNDIIVSVFTAILQIVMLSSILIKTSLVSLILIVISVSLGIIINNKLNKLNYDYSVRHSRNNKRVNYLYRLFYTPQFIKDMKINSMENFVFERKETVNQEILSLVDEEYTKKTPFWISAKLLGTIEYVLMALYFGFSVIIGHIAVAEYITCLNAYQQIKAAMNDLFSTVSELYNNSLFSQDYINFMDSDEQNTTNDTGIPLTTDSFESIEFKKVSFRYPNSTADTLKDVSFTINKGEKVAILGKNGAGKTTIIKLLLRLYDADSGEILINGKSIKEYNTYDIRTTFSTLFQDFAVYAFSVRDNIAQGKTVDDNEIINVLSKVGLKEKIYALAKGLDTPITSQLYDGGVEFSGGETQKLALSRIYLRNTSMFVLDEPTSSLDPYAEYELYKTLLATSKDTTAIVISHRLTLTNKMDKILVIDNGMITESGTHESLMKLNGIYTEMYTLQKEKYTD